MWNYWSRDQTAKGGNVPALPNKREERGRNKNQSSLRFHFAFPSHICLSSTLPLFSQHPLHFLSSPLHPISQLTHTTPAEAARSSCPPGRERDGRRRRWWGRCHRCGSPPGWARCSRCMWDLLERTPPRLDVLRWRGTRRGGDSQEEGVCILTRDWYNTSTTQIQKYTPRVNCAQKKVLSL